MKHKEVRIRSEGEHGKNSRLGGLSLWLLYGKFYEL